MTGLLYAGFGSAAATSSDGTTMATSVSANPTMLKSFRLYNANAAVRYLKFYNKASAPIVGTNTPLFIHRLEPTAHTSVEFRHPIPFNTGLAYAITTGVADSDTGAPSSGDILGLHLLYGDPL